MPPRILIVGAGTTGLTLACELARHGTEARVIDRLAGTMPYARATGVHSRTLEVFQDLGIADEIIARSAFIRGANQYAGGELIMHFRSDGLDSPFPFSASLEQWKVEETLEGLLHDLGGAVERETELTALEECGDCVRATLRHADGSVESVETPWLIGCDGAHSLVRHLKGEHFPGEADPRQYLVADVVLEHGRVADEVFIYLTDHGVLWWFPLPDGRSLLAGDVREQHSPEETPTLQDVQALIEQRVPAGIVARDARWLSWFHIHYRLTPHYRHGRTFLAGDAAHIHSPIGGQGMNTGIQDAYNLGWKLALVARGRAPESLLDSYEVERRAIAQDVLATTRGLTEKAEAYVTLPPGEREHLFRHVVLPEADRLQMLHHNEELDLDYRKSPISTDCLAEATLERPAFGGHHAGAEARDAGPLQVEGRRVRLFDLLRGPQHTLLLVPGTESGLEAVDSHINVLAARLSPFVREQIRILVSRTKPLERQDPGSEVGIQIHDMEGAIERRYGGPEPRAYLIRPDGYIGFRGELSQLGPLIDHLNLMFREPRAA